MRKLLERWRTLLTPVSWIYAGIITARNYLYDKHLLGITVANCPVISVGNITTGGTGKTPLVEFLTSHLLGRGRKIVVLSRGYGRKSRGTVIVSDGVSLLCGAAEGGDEAVQVARKFPRCVVVVDENRRRGAQYAVDSFAPDVIVLDDGFQHRALHRDLDIVVLDESRNASSIRMLPAGNRREPLSSLERAHFFVHNRAEESPDRMTAAGEGGGGTPSAGMRYEIRGFFDGQNGMPVPAETLRAGNITAFCGVGHPASFRSLLIRSGLTPAAFLEFPDHHKYTRKDFSMIREESRRAGSGFLLTTEKDAVRIQGMGSVPGLSIPGFIYTVMTATLSAGENELLAAVDALGRGSR